MLGVIGENDDAIDKIHNYGLKTLKSSRMIVIDTIRIDEHSHLTYTKKVKSVFPVAPQYTIVVYQDKYNKDELLFKIQRETVW